MNHTLTGSGLLPDADGETTTTGKRRKAAADEVLEQAGSIHARRNQYGGVNLFGRKTGFKPDMSPPNQSVSA